VRAVVQRVSRASVVVDDEVIGDIDHGLLVLLGVTHGDTTAHSARLAGKIARMRILDDGDGKMNRSVLDTGGGVLAVSQFTLFADTRRGNRPGFTLAAPPALAEELYESFKNELRSLGIDVRSGRFGGDMKVELVNDGPVTILLDTDDLSPA
jgi:D-aminoacyl-tRNA deacylase